ncbi:MAG: PAS domain-containing sensor histidine kinase [Pseudomonadota bacterium]
MSTLPPAAPLQAEPSGLAGRLLALWPQQERAYAVLCLDPAGTIVGVSAGTPLVLGWQPQELLGRPAALVFTDEDLQRRLDAHERDVASSVGHAEDDRWHQRKDGTRIWMSGVMTAIREPDGRCIGYVKVLRDRTDLRAQIETLEHRVSALRGALERKDAQFTTLAHELANPLSPLLQACHLLSRADEQQRPRLLEVIGRQLESLRRLIGDLRSAVGRDGAPPELAIQRFVLQELLLQVTQACMGEAVARQQQLELLAAEVPIWIDADPARLHQVVLNLVGNAIKYTPAGGRVWIKATVEADDAVIRVEDTGVGIAPEMLPRIFDLFTQDPDSRHLSRGGLGVGLAVVKNLVDLHGGTVEVRSDGRGKGSHFAVRLPLRRSGAAGA